MQDRDITLEAANRCQKQLLTWISQTGNGPDKVDTIQALSSIYRSLEDVANLSNHAEKLIQILSAAKSREKMLRDTITSRYTQTGELIFPLRDRHTEAGAMSTITHVNNSSFVKEITYEN